MGDKIQHRVNTRTLIRNNIRNYTMFLMLALIMIIFAFMTNGVNLNSRNFTNIIIQNSYVFLLAVGMVQIMILGCIDLSVGSVCAFVGAISAMVYNTGAGMFAATMVGMVIGLAIGAFQGFWVAYMKMPAFIVTLAGMLLFRGLTYIITNVTPVGLHDDGYKQLASGMANIPGLQIGNFYPTAMIVGILVFAVYVGVEFIARHKKIKNNFDVAPMGIFLLKLAVVGFLVIGLCQRFATYRGLPWVAILLAVVVFVFHFMMKNTVLGRYIYAVGGNARSAKLSGINSELVIFVVFCIMGCLTGIAGVVFTGYMNSALPQAGNMFEMDAIASCYIGGVSASGGIGTIIGVIVGGLVMAAINNGMSLMNIGQQWQYVVKAAIILLAVFYDVYSRRRSGLG